MNDEDGAPPPSTQRQLDRAPGERYRSRPDVPAPAAAAAPAAAPSRAIAVAVPILVAAAGVALIGVLGSFDIGPGLLAVSAFIGWAVAVAVVWGSDPAPERRGRRVRLAVGLAVGSIVVGLVVLWAYSRTEGGVMDPVAYLDERFGPLAIADIVVAGIVAWVRAR
jgi:ABC-type Fe3+-siderophore transport system permease subunit